MKVFVAVICFLTICSTVFGAEPETNSGVGPFVCACEYVDSYNDGGYSRMLVTNLSNGKIYKIGKWVGGSTYGPKNAAQASQQCTDAMKIQAVCTSGKPNL